MNNRRYEVPLRLKFADDAREATEYKIDVAPLEQVDRLFIALSCLHSIAAHLQHELSNGQDLVISIDTENGLLALRRRYLLFRNGWRVFIGREATDAEFPSDDCSLFS